MRLNTHPPRFNYKKARWNVYQSYIVEHLPSLDIDCVNIHQAPPLLLPLLARSCQGLYPLWPPWSFPQILVVPGSGIRSARATEGPLRGTPVWGSPPQMHTVDTSRRASSVISRAKSATWQATCSYLSPRSDPRTVFRLLNAILGEKEHLPRPFFSRLQFPSWHCQSLFLLSSLTSISSNTPYLAQSRTTVHEWTSES